MDSKNKSKSSQAGEASRGDSSGQRNQQGRGTKGADGHNGSSGHRDGTARYSGDSGRSSDGAVGNSRGSGRSSDGGNKVKYGDSRKDGYQKTNSLKDQWQSNHRENMLRDYKFSRVQLKSEPHPEVQQQLEQCYKRKRPPPQITLDEFIENSIKFWDKFPSETARLHVLRDSGVSVDKLEGFVHSVYPIVHHTTLPLMCDFLNHKRRYGSTPEKNLYKDMDLLAFIDRLLKARPMSFLGANDQYYLPAPTFKHGYGGWEAVGTVNERPPLLLQDYLSYDEMRIAALISLSSWSVFVNDGRRKNYGEKDKDGTYQPDGVIVGQVGARLKKEGVMDYLDCVVTRKENKPENGFGSDNTQHVNHVWGKLWGGVLPTYQEANSSLREQRDGSSRGRSTPFEYMPVGENLLFNVTVYKKRIAITAEILICEARARARAAGKKAYIHVVGLGLGVWRASEEQDQLFVDAWGDALHNITDTSDIAFIDFSHINCWSIDGVKNNGQFPNTNIIIRFSKRNLHDKVPGDCILVCNYAWDGNSLPGNEFWLEKMCSTGDSAAACSSCVAEIHNHFINPVVGADAMRVATSDGCAVPWEDYFTGIHSSTNEFNSLGVAYPQVAGLRATGDGAHCPTADVAPQPSTSCVEGDAAREQESQRPAGSTSTFDSIPDPPAHLDGVSQPQNQNSFSEKGDHSPLTPASVVHAEVILSSEAQRSKAVANEPVAEVVGAAEEVVPPPKVIPHPTIMGLMIDNPAFKIFQKKKSPKKKESVGDPKKESGGDSGEPKPKKNAINASGVKGENQTKAQITTKGKTANNVGSKKNKGKKSK